MGIPIQGSCSIGKKKFHPATGRSSTGISFSRFTTAVVLAGKTVQDVVTGGKKDRHEMQKDRYTRDAFEINCFGDKSLSAGPVDNAVTLLFYLFIVCV